MSQLGHHTDLKGELWIDGMPANMRYWSRVQIEYETKNGIQTALCGKSFRGSQNDYERHPFKSYVFETSVKDWSADFKKSNENRCLAYDLYFNKNEETIRVIEQNPGTYIYRSTSGHINDMLARMRLTDPPLPFDWNRADEMEKAHRALSLRGFFAHAVTGTLVALIPYSNMSGTESIMEDRANDWKAWITAGKFVSQHGVNFVESMLLLCQQYTTLVQNKSYLWKKPVADLLSVEVGYKSPITTQLVITYMRAQVLLLLDPRKQRDIGKIVMFAAMASVDPAHYALVNSIVDIHEHIPASMKAMDTAIELVSWPFKSMSARDEFRSFRNEEGEAKTLFLDAYYTTLQIDDEENKMFGLGGLSLNGDERQLHSDKVRERLQQDKKSAQRVNVGEWDAKAPVTKSVAESFDDKHAEQQNWQRGPPPKAKLDRNLKKEQRKKKKKGSSSDDSSSRELNVRTSTPRRAAVDSPECDPRARSERGPGPTREGTTDPRAHGARGRGPLAARRGRARPRPTYLESFVSSGYATEYTATHDPKCDWIPLAVLPLVLCDQYGNPNSRAYRVLRHLIKRDHKKRKRKLRRGEEATHPAKTDLLYAFQLPGVAQAISYLCGETKKEQARMRIAVLAANKLLTKDEFPKMAEKANTTRGLDYEAFGFSTAEAYKSLLRAMKELLKLVRSYASSLGCNPQHECPSDQAVALFRSHNLSDILTIMPKVVKPLFITALSPVLMSGGLYAKILRQYSRPHAVIWFMNAMLEEEFAENERVETIMELYEEKLKSVYSKEKEPTMSVGAAAASSSSAAASSTGQPGKASSRQLKKERQLQRQAQKGKGKNTYPPAGPYAGKQNWNQGGWGSSGGWGKAGGWGGGGGQWGAPQQQLQSYHYPQQGKGGWNSTWTPGGAAPQPPQQPKGGEETMKEIRTHCAPHLARKLGIAEEQLWELVKQRKCCILYGGHLEKMMSARSVAVYCRHKVGCLWSHQETAAKHGVVCLEVPDEGDNKGKNNPNGGGKQNNPKGPKDKDNKGKPPW
eukprot:g17600.t1